MIYLDNAATTKITKEVLAEMFPYLCDEYGNPSSLHSCGKRANKAIKNARERVATAINAEPYQIFFTSGATESNNWVLKNFRTQLCSPYEHHSVYNNCTFDYGCYKKIENAICDYLPDIVSHIMVNNETGEIYDIKDICSTVHKYKLPFHTDATQAFGHIPIDVKDLDIDFLSLSGHKFHAPKGVGVLYIKEPDKFKPMLKGGHQEQGLRAGTENVASIVAMGKAAELYNYKKEVQDKIQVLTTKLEREIAEKLRGRIFNSSDKNRISTISSISFEGVNGEALMMALDFNEICISTGSACNSNNNKPSHVLKAMGVSEDYIHGTIRISLDEYTTIDDIDKTINCVVKCVKQLRGE